MLSSTEDPIYHQLIKAIGQERIGIAKEEQTLMEVLGDTEFKYYNQEIKRLEGLHKESVAKSKYEIIIKRKTPDFAEKITEETKKAKLTPEQQELIEREKFVRQQAGLDMVKPRKGQTKAEAEFQKLTAYFLKQHVESWEEEDIKKAQTVLQSVRSGTRFPKEEITHRAATVEGGKRKGFTSAAAEFGEEASASMQAAYRQQQGAIGEMMGATAEGAEAGAVITIKLAPGLQGEIEEVSGLRVELRQGAGAAA
jgi:hypothetical protein